MMPSRLNRFKEFYCVLFGHEFNEHYQEKEGELVLEEHFSCVNCGLSTIDISGRLQKYAMENSAKEPYIK